MKKLTKTFLSVAAVSALTAAMAASASAMTATYVEGEVNTVTLSDVATSGTSQTMIILNEDAQTVESTMVKAIDQKDKQATDESNPVFTSVPVNALEDGIYYVRIGGTDGSMQTATFTVGSAPVVETETIVIGDADLNGTVTMGDANAVATKSVGTETAQNANVKSVRNVVSGIDKETITIGDADLNGTVTMGDANAIATKSVGTETAQNADVRTQVTVEKAN